MNHQGTNKQEKTKHKLAASIIECMKTTSLDLVNWYFDELLLQYFDKIGKGEAIKKSLGQKFVFMLEEKNFYLQAFKHEGQNSLKEHDLKLISWYYRRWIEEKTGQELAEEMEFMLHFFLLWLCVYDGEVGCGRNERFAGAAC